MTLPVQRVPQSERLGRCCQLWPVVDGLARGADHCCAGEWHEVLGDVAQQVERRWHCALSAVAVPGRRMKVIACSDGRYGTWLLLSGHLGCECPSL